MTADVELPTPFHYANAGKGEALFTANQLHACVAHATAAKDAEIEALRAEVERLKIDVGGYMNAALAENAACQQAEARAERLAEALRECRDWFETQAKSISKGNGSSWDLMQVREQRDLCDAALEQESGRG